MRYAERSDKRMLRPVSRRAVCTCGAVFIRRFDRTVGRGARRDEAGTRLPAEPCGARAL